MSACGEPSGFLMRNSWRAGAVLAHKLELRGGRYAPAKARAWVAELLAEHVFGVDRLDTLVLVSELVTNAVRHGKADEQETVIVHLAIAADVLRVEVCDDGPGFTPPAMPTARRHGGGNGLVMLATMSSSWGVAGDDGTCVWFERMLGLAGSG
jgi:two-component sensor histidine kinase